VDEDDEEEDLFTEVGTMELEPAGERTQEAEV